MITTLDSQLKLLSTFPRPRTARGFGRRGWNRFGGWIAEGQQHLARPFGIRFAQFLHRLPERAQPKIIVTFRAFNAVEKRREFNQFAAGVHEIEIQNLLTPAADEDETLSAKLRAYRDRALLITLADTGFRVHEACNLRRGDIDWNEGRAVIIGKGNKQAVVRFTSRSMQAIKDYLSQRAALDGISGKQLSSLPLFARHDKGAGKKIKPITPTTGRNIVKERVLQILGKESVGKITPHSFRHYFVTMTYLAKRDLKLSQILARHESISTTNRYAHFGSEADEAYDDIFNKK
jgi:integrase